MGVSRVWGSFALYGGAWWTGAISGDKLSRSFSDTTVWLRASRGVKSSITKNTRSDYLAPIHYCLSLVCNYRDPWFGSDSEKGQIDPFWQHWSPPFSFEPNSLSLPISWLLVLSFGKNGLPTFAAGVIICGFLAVLVQVFPEKYRKRL
jgi:hypothetical protein